MRFKFGKYIITLVVSIFISFSINATHIMGGEFKISMINHNTAGGEYNIQLRLFRDDANAAVDLPPMVTIGIYQIGSHSLYATLDLNLLNGSGNIIPLGDSCYTPDPTLFNIQEGFYYSFNSILLPNYSSGYYLQFQTCCRTNALSNLLNPGSLGISILAIIPDPGIGINSSPDFGIYPIDAYFCANSINRFTWPVTDPDGDSLVFSLATPLNHSPPSFFGNSSPGGGSYPYYPYCPYASGYNQYNMIGGNLAMSIHPSTGEITCRPSNIGFFVFTVLVEEFRNGVKIGEVRRDAQFKSELCDLSDPPSVLTNTNSPECTHTFEMFDSYGDGWNGGSVDVLVNGTNVLTNAGASFNSGFSSSLPFMASHGDTIQLANWSPGGYPGEISWRVSNELGISGSGLYPSTIGGNGGCYSDSLFMDINFDDSSCIDLEIGTVNFNWNTADSTFTKLISDIDLVRGYIEPNSHINGLFNTSLAYYNWAGIAGNTVYFNPYVFKNGYIGTKGNIYLRYCWEDLCNGNDSTLNILIDSYAIDCSGNNSNIQNISINCVTGLDLQFLEKKATLIYPNPTTGEIIISLNNFNGNIKSEVFDLMGNKLFSTNKKIINLKNYAKGIYIIKLEYGNIIEDFKVVRE